MCSSPSRILSFNNHISLLHVAYFSFTICAQSLEFNFFALIWLFLFKGELAVKDIIFDLHAVF